ncbi:AMP-binding protein [Actinomadura hibisca]|uniref:AMP-binding protein n=1 Tax=Actinomadura hibisca TaxID=68565 RepID=UPI00082AEDC3|nr:AMP-binding protein [Actinomadura hibisca]
MTAATARPRPGLHHLLVEAARTSPHAPAVIEPADSSADSGPPAVRTYAQLLAHAERYADALRSGGITRGDHVVVDAPNSAATIAMLMACSMAGAAFVPLTPEVPDERARQILALSRARGYAHLTTTGRLDRIGGPGGLAVVTYGWDAPPAVSSTVPPAPAAGTGDLAYLFFTSGSTGVPKGVAMPQHATCAFFDATRGMLRPDDRVASTAPLQFDFCLLDIGMCLANRCAIVPVPRDLLRWPRRIVDVLSATGCTRVHAVPSVWRPLLRRQPRLLAELPPLDAVMFSGEPFPPDELRILHRALPDTRVVNCYGPTECMACSFTDVTAYADGSAGGLPVDGAYPGAALDIVDDDGVVIGEPGRSGQLRFTGPSVFAGYWQADGAVHPPPAVGRDAAGTPTLLTGDYAHRAADGRLRFDGRRDRQVKVGGNRVELAEIEAALCRAPGVEEARVVADTGGPDVTLVAFVGGPDADPGDDGAGWRRWCAALPPYMRPARVVHLPHLPKGPNGKVDQQRLTHQTGSH